MFCSELCLSKYKMTRYAKNLEPWPLAPGCAYDASVWLITARNQRAFIFCFRSRWPFHHQWLPAPLSRFERTAPAHQKERRIALPCLRRHVGTLPVSWYDCDTHRTFSHPLFSFLPCFHLQGVTNIAFPSKIETWNTRKLQVHIL